MSTITDLRTPPVDPLAAQVDARYHHAARMLCDDLAGIATACTVTAAAVGESRPLTNAEQAQVLMALQQVTCSLGAYQTLALLENSQQHTEAVLTAIDDALDAVVVPLGLASDEPDPLAAFRLTSGEVAYYTGHADEVRVGQWVQACHGDEGNWTRVDGIHPAGAMVGLDLRGSRKWWERAGAIRVACTPAESVARQGADRGEVEG